VAGCLRAAAGASRQRYETRGGHRSTFTGLFLRFLGISVIDLAYFFGRYRSVMLPAAISAAKNTVSDNVG
jgi:hypothetical protein